MNLLRAAVAALAVCVAVVLQVSVFPHLAWDGIVPDLCLLVVVGAALARGPHFAAVLGFAAGVVLDLAPPADHLAGRWALALVLVGYVAGRVRQDARPNASTVVVTVAASSFVGTSVFALSGLFLGDSSASVGDLLQVALVALVLDTVAALLVVPATYWLFRRLGRERGAQGLWA